jgi:hypothetical protein
MRNVSAPKNSSGGKSAPAGSKSMGGGSAGRGKEMPRVGGHSTNNAAGPGVANDKGC